MYFHPPSSTEQADAYNRQLGPRVGDELHAIRLFRNPEPLTVVGISKPTPLGGKPIAWMTRQTLATLIGEEGKLSDVEIKLANGVDAEEFSNAHAAAFSGKALVQTTERMTSGVNQQFLATQIIFVLISVITLMSA